ncbi:hypothetical protein [Limimaricola hongkongensis]|uniref:hypothetical protein n=1 Tax=Limimaricola hongkongensis TaxID=278132 RepID=UPI0003758343|nr:hypothetical protein [Limimaricola hongkongensis]
MFNKIAGFLVVSVAMTAGTASAELRSAEIGLSSQGTSGDSGDIGTGTFFGNVDLAFADSYGLQVALQSSHSEDQNSFYEADTAAIVTFGYSDFGFGRFGAVLGRTETDIVDGGASIYGLGLQFGQSGDSLHTSHVFAIADVDDVSDETVLLSSLSAASVVSERVAITGDFDYSYIEVLGYDVNAISYSIGLEFYATPRVQLGAALGGAYADDGNYSASDATAALSVSYLFGNDVGVRRQRNLTAMNFGF